VGRKKAKPFRPSPAFASGEKLTEVILPTVDPYMKPTHSKWSESYRKWCDEDQKRLSKYKSFDAHKAKQ